MATIDVSHATRPTRARVGGADRDRAAKFSKRMPPSAKQSVFIRMKILLAMRTPPVNPNRTAISDGAAASADIKALVKDLGADAVGVAEINPDLVFTQAGDLKHTRAIVYGVGMSFDTMADIGPASQEEVHRVYHNLDELGVRLAQRIAAMGYNASMQPNEGDIPLVAFAQMAGLGELGKHGSLISPQLGASFRLGAVTTDMPLAADGPQDFGFDEVCAKCGVCERFCPGDAIKPEKKTVNGVTRWHVDTPACEPYFHRLYGCKICLMVCPLNSRSIFRESFKANAKLIVQTKNAQGMLSLIEERSGISYEEFES